MLNILVQAGMTLWALSMSHGVSLQAVEAANPQIANPNLIYAGQTVVHIPTPGPVTVPAAQGNDGDHDSDDPAAPATSENEGGGGSGAAPSALAQQPGGSAAGGTIGAIPGMPASFAACIAMRESSSVYGSSVVGNPAAGGNAYGIIPASGYNVAGMSIAQQNQVAAQLYAKVGAAAWAPFDGC